MVGSLTPSADHSRTANIQDRFGMPFLQMAGMSTDEWLSWTTQRKLTTEAIISPEIQSIVGLYIIHVRPIPAAHTGI
jgi:hypothetical protein